MGVIGSFPSLPGSFVFSTFMFILMFLLDIMAKKKKKKKNWGHTSFFGKKILGQIAWKVSKEQMMPDALVPEELWNRLSLSNAKK